MQQYIHRNYWSLIYYILLWKNPYDKQTTPNLNSIVFVFVYPRPIAVVIENFSYHIIDGVTCFFFNFNVIVTNTLYKLQFRLNNINLFIIRINNKFKGLFF